MSTIRPPLPNALPATPPGPQDPARQAAQKAFFEAALGRAAPTPAQVQAQAPPRAADRAVQGAEIQVRAAPAREIPHPIRSPDEAPQKILRPGSLLDIRV